ncbi:hypothetical protein LuPra_01991 [Luteitalea pratensis]|uniref:DUF4097 domain-containing protein n=1 Tax=Luteitalea pratensis TaxID=1855912 RepID=A0A143PK33_LUTPR|nr:DUF4097 family beta strand repeat-containing protein [Luteitalea pratensis]AMY08786.1 hypothetical protein LuPra_01991 [Luteitalea pratensis]
MSVRLSSAIAASLLVIVPALASAQSLTFEKTVTVGASPSLDVSTGSGEVTVQGGSGNAMVIKGTVKVRTGWNVPSNAADLAQRLLANPPITQSGDAVTVGKIADEDTRRAVSVSYQITVPAPTAVQANSGSGSVSVTGVGGAVKANSGSGSVTAASIGGDVDLRTGSGDISLKDGKKGAALSTGSGSIQATLSGQGDVKANTGSGDISLTGVVGLLTASTGSGSIGVSGKPTGDWKVSAASGNVTVDVPEEQGFSLDASTSSGSLDITAPLTVQGRIDRRRVQGTVHGGGPMLRLSTASGNIAVK